MSLEIKKPDIEYNSTNEEGTEGTFVVYPLPRGFGTTLGNSLRRVLLSSLPGVAATQIRIDGVLHEMSTVPGVKEDVTEIVLNVKGIIAKFSNPATESVIVRIDKKGPCTVTAGDIVSVDGLEILNPDLHIATLGEGASFSMELRFARGIGYVSAEHNEEFAKANGIAAIDAIYTDSIHTPIRNVGYQATNTRVGSDTDYDKLELNVKTNGTITVSSAVSSAATIICDVLSYFIEVKPDIPEIVVPAPEVTEQQASKEEKIRDENVLDITVEDLDLTVRSFNCLKRADINTVRDLIGKTMEDMTKVRNLGKKSLNEIIDKLDSFGLKLREVSEEE